MEPADPRSSSRAIDASIRRDQPAQKRWICAALPKPALQVFGAFDGYARPLFLKALLLR